TQLVDGIFHAGREAIDTEIEPSLRQITDEDDVIRQLRKRANDFKSRDDKSALRAQSAKHDDIAYRTLGRQYFNALTDIQFLKMWLDIRVLGLGRQFFMCHGICSLLSKYSDTQLPRTVNKTLQTPGQRPNHRPAFANFRFQRADG